MVPLRSSAGSQKQHWNEINSLDASPRGVLSILAKHLSVAAVVTGCARHPRCPVRDALPETFHELRETGLALIVEARGLGRTRAGS